MTSNLLMYMRTRIYKLVTLIIIISVAAASCGGNRQAAAGDSRFQREPIREVTQEQLELDSRLINAVSLQESGRTDEALNAYGKIVADKPQCAAAWYEMGALLLQRGWTDSALACANRAVALNPDNVWYHLEKAKAHELRGEGKEMAMVYEKLVKLQPENLDYYYELSNAYIAAGNLTAAVEALNRVEKKIGITEPISLQKQRLWEAAGKPDKAMREIEALAASMPGDKRYNAILAELNMKQQRYAKAKEYYDRIVEADPNDEYIHIQLAEYYKQTGQPEMADAEMLKAFANPKLDSQTKLRLLGSFYTTEEFYSTRSATTFRLLDMAMAGCEDSSQFAALYGDALMRQQKYREATPWLETVLRKDSSNYALWEALLICLSEDSSREADMVGYARRAEKLFPLHTLPHFIQGMNALQHDRYEEALEHFEAAEKWGFNKQHYLEAETYRMMAEAYYRTGQYDRCLQAFENSLKVEPDSWMTLNNYAYYLAERNMHLDKAEQMSRRTIEAEPDNANSLDTYAWILHLQGRDAEALEYMQRAVRLDPNSTTLRNHLQVIQSAR